MRLTDVDKLSEHKFTRESAKSSDYMRGWNDAIDTIIDNAPTVDTTFREVVAYECGQKSVERPHGEWIPVSERLPKIDAENGWKASDVVLVYLADGKMHMGFYCEDKKWRFCESGEAKEPFVFDVIAWMPLPKSYKETEKNDT